MKLLVSPASIAEAQLALEAPVDVIDIKNPAEGSLGCQHPAVALEMSKLARQAGREVSIAIGDLHHQPGTAAMAAVGAAQLGADYIKAGLRGSRTVAQATNILSWIIESLHSIDRVGHRRPLGVGCAYADYRAFDGLSPESLVRAASAAHGDYVMLDTLHKDGRTLFDHTSMSELREFVMAARQQGLKVALAGSLEAAHLPQLRELQPDFIGVRGAICENSDRQSTICPHRTRAFANAATSTVESK